MILEMLDQTPSNAQPLTTWQQVDMQVCRVLPDNLLHAMLIYNTFYCPHLYQIAKSGGVTPGCV